jgi:DnaJ-class molecular chaperone
MTPNPSNSMGLKPRPVRDRNLIGDGEPMACPRCAGRGHIGHGQGRYGETIGGWKNVYTPCPVCLGRGVVAAL